MERSALQRRVQMVAWVARCSSLGNGDKEEEEEE